MADAKKVIRLNYKAYMADADRLYDTTYEQDAKDAGIYNEKVKYQPMAYIVGSKKLFPALDKAISEAKVGEEFTVEIPAEEGAGARNPKLVETHSVKEFYKQRLFYSRSALIRDYVNNMTVELNLDNPVQLQYVSSQWDYLGPYMARNPKMAGKVAAPGGTYDPSTNTIYLFPEKMGDNGVETLRTIAHLVRHAYQFTHAQFNSPVMKGLREGAYEAYSEFDPSRQNPAEVDAENYANYIVERAYNAYDEWVKNPDIVKVENNKSFKDPASFYEVNPA